MVNTNLIARFFNQTPMMQHPLSTEQLEILRQFIKELQVGTSIEGILIKELNAGYVLKINEEIHIPVSILEPTQLGQLLKFDIVAKKQDEIQLKIHKQGPTLLLDKVIQDLGLPKDERMNKCLNHFMQKELTLIREDILHTYYIEKYYQIPSEVITNLLGRKSGMTEHEANTLVRLKQQGLEGIACEIKEMIEKCIGEEQLKAMFKNPLKAAKNPIQDIIYSLKDSLEIGLGKREKLVDSLIGINPKNPINLKKQLQIKLEKLYQVISFIETQAKSENYKERILPLKESLEVVQKLNDQGNYFLFPLIYGESLNQAEIYFFQPKKAQRNKKHATYVVIALDLSALQHIELHIHKIDKTLSIEIIVANEVIEQWLMTYTAQLKLEVEQMGYVLEQCTYKVQGEMSNEVEHQTIGIDHFDFKI